MIVGKVLSILDVSIKVILSTDCDAGLNVLWKWFKEKKRGKQSGRNTA